MLLLTSLWSGRFALARRRSAVATAAAASELRVVRVDHRTDLLLHRRCELQLAVKADGLSVAIGAVTHGTWRVQMSFVDIVEAPPTTEPGGASVAARRVPAVALTWGKSTTVQAAAIEW